jgi:ATP-dependent Zn protease
MVLVVVGILVWNFSTRFQTNERPIPFSEFMNSVNAGGVEKVTITGNEIRGISRSEMGDRAGAVEDYTRAI